MARHRLVGHARRRGSDTWPRTSAEERRPRHPAEEAIKGVEPARHGRVGSESVCGGATPSRHP